MVEGKRVAPLWKKKNIDIETSKALQEVLKIHPIFCDLLVDKGMQTFEEAKLFFRPELEHLHDPFTMKDMDKAVIRLEEAMAANEKILIYGDYDVDGTTSVALMYHFLIQFYPNLEFYIPDRHSEGYGVSMLGVQHAIDNNFKLMIALDCGIRANEKVAYAAEHGVDFIICDHHTPGAELPPAVAVLDPKRSDCSYKNDELSGCGIGFKFCQAYVQKHQLDEQLLFQFLDLVAVSIACDIVPIVGENRVLAHFGLRALNSNPSIGLKNLKDLIESEQDYTISDVVFKIGPRINAAGRMGHAKEAVNVLLGKTEVDHLQEKNTERRVLDKSTTEEALNQLLEDPKEEEKVTTVVYNPSWHKGVVGIVASRLIESYYRPTVVFSESDGLLTGSARSVKNFNVYEPLFACKDLFEKFGGHAYAAGMTMPLENLEVFKQRFEAEVKTRILPEHLIPEIEIDAILSVKDVNDKFFKILKQFAPFGPGNLKPNFCLRGLRDNGYTRIVGENHLKIYLRDVVGNKLNGIAFKMAYKLPLVEKGPVDVVGTLEENTWNNRTTIEILVKDIKLAEN